MTTQWLKHFLLPSKKRRRTAESTPQNKATAKAVSYTHLDVYKRQQLALGRVHGLTAVEPQRLGIGHHAGAEHIFKIFQDLDRDFTSGSKAERNKSVLNALK